MATLGGFGDLSGLTAALREAERQAKLTTTASKEITDATKCAAAAQKDTKQAWLAPDFSELEAKKKKRRLPRIPRSL